MDHYKRVITFRKLSQLLPGFSAAERTNIAAGMLAGELSVTTTSPQEAAKVVSFVTSTTGWPFVRAPKSDAQIDRAVKRLGEARVLASLDRLTQPQFDFLAE
jgi:hypothetical protein